MKDINYYQKEKKVLDLELISLLKQSPKDSVAITKKRGEILVNLKKQYMWQKREGNIVEQNNLKSEVNKITTEHKNQLKERKKEKIAKPDYNISKKTALNFKQASSKTITDKKSIDSKNKIIKKAMIFPIGVSAKLIVNVSMNGAYYIGASSYYIWNSRHAIKFEKTKIGKILKKGKDFASNFDSFYVDKYVK